MTAPKKYIKVDGVMRLNPEYQRYMKRRNGGKKPATTVYSPNNALPIVSSMDDHMEINEASQQAGGPQIALSDATNATIEMMQEPEISLEAGMQPDEMVDALGAIMNKYEVPMGLMNKLMMLSEYQSLEFIIDDSGSMSLLSDTFDKHTGRPQTRWQEAQVRLKEMVEILAYIPFSQIDIVFLNRSDHVCIIRNGKDPNTFLREAYGKIDQVFVRGPRGTTPALEKLQDSLIKGQGKNIARYFFGDGIPNGGKQAQERIIQILCARINPEGNPITFLSCTNEDDQVEWMKDAEEVIPYCSESDDFDDEAREVLRDQGSALPYSKGFHLICQLVAAMNPDDLDAMDESVPFTKRTLDNILGIENNEQSYRHYFQSFVQAQRSRKIEGPTDQLKKSYNWEALYSEFLRAPVARQIPAVQEFQKKLQQHGNNTSSTPFNNYNSFPSSSYISQQQPPYNPTYNPPGTYSSYQQQPTVVQGMPTTYTTKYGNNNNTRNNRKTKSNNKHRSFLPRFGRAFEYPGQKARY